MRKRRGGLEGIARFCSALGERAPDGLAEARLGGLEEEIIRRGSDWCTDVARAACALCQVAGIPARLVCLADTARAYCGHAIIEAARSGVWGAADPSTAVVYRLPGGRPASTWDLMSSPDLIEAHCRATGGFYTTPGQFRAGAIAEYAIWKRREYDYTVSALNEYYRTILEMSAAGWPGGLRWLHGGVGRPATYPGAPGAARRREGER
ncbi:MAG: hypothetical protein HY321_13780 [Armatimonadetes bacterium]|nr:hypothetical protein [Armatimonadota bacterium]